MKLRVVTHSGEEFNVQVESFNAVEFNQQLNDNNVHTVELGGVIISRIDIKIVQPIQEDIPEETVEEATK